MPMCPFHGGDSDLRIRLGVCLYEGLTGHHRVITMDIQMENSGTKSYIVGQSFTARAPRRPVSVDSDIHQPRDILDRTGGNWMPLPGPGSHLRESLNNNVLAACNELLSPSPTKAVTENNQRISLCPCFDDSGTATTEKESQ